ncbi:MAG: hypothetical protein KAS97_03440 [Candidatus Aminicenantes bacterium]|nr:hypothetical protein [Candidatus Aminicenantes bacterium]
MNKSVIIYSKTGIEVGKFKILDISGDKALCECLDHSADVDNECYVKVGGNPGTIKKLKRNPIINEPEKRTAGKSGIIKVRGIRFVEQKNGVFITENPVPASMVPDISFSGIINFMKKIETRYGEKCKVNYLETGEIKEYFILREEMIMLGVKSGTPVIVSFSNSGFRENRVSEKIISKLKYEIYIPLKLKRL